ncbi:MAG TPA: hypothetical protein VLK27_04685 [Chthoniobacterales bacterium]|nr:hypothetical protein [Chthoniobacterales bacterium]
MKKPSGRGPSPSRKAQLVLRDKLNRKPKPVPPFPTLEQTEARQLLAGRNKRHATK